MLKTLDINPTKDKLAVELVTAFRAICPVDNNPDFYSLEIWFIPDKCTLDIISLRQYLSSYCFETILAENLAIDIIAVLDKELCPRKLSVKLTNDAEGIKIKVKKEK